MRIPSLHVKCPWCDKFEEMIEPLFWLCELADWAWSFIGNWWCNRVITNRLLSFSVASLFNLHARIQKGKVWGLVIASMIWSIWLARNEALFTLKKISKEYLEFLIMTRIEKWDKASKIMVFGNDPMWKVNF